MLMCEPFDIHRQRGGKTHRTILQACLFSPEFRSGLLERNSFVPVTRMIKGNRERVVLDLLSNIKWVRSSGYSRRTSGGSAKQFLLFKICFFCFCLCSPRLFSCPPSRSHALPCVDPNHASVCRKKMSQCVPAKTVHMSPAAAASIAAGTWDLRNQWRTLPGLLAALAASLDRLWPHTVTTLRTSWTVQEVIAAEARLLETVHHEVGTYTPAGWVHLLAARFSLKAEQLRQRTPTALPHSLAAVPADVMRSGVLRVAAGSARVCPLSRTSHRAALGAPLGLSCVCFGCVFYRLDSGGADSALARVAFLGTDLLPVSLP